MNKGYILIVVLLASGGIFSGFLYYRQMLPVDKVDISVFPKELGEWKSEDIYLDERTYDVLETRNVLARNYKSSRGNVYFFIVFSETNRKVSHPPEVCYEGEGTEVSEKGSFALDMPELKEPLSINKFIAQKGNQKELVFYWYKAGDKFTSNYLKQQVRIMLGQLVGKRMSGALIRISVPLIDNNESKAFETFREFSSSAVPLILKSLP